MEISVENCKLIEGLKFAKNFLGKGTISAAEKCVKIEVKSATEAWIIANNRESCGICSIEILSATGTGEFPIIEHKGLLGVCSTLNHTLELTITSTDKSIEINYTGRKTPIEINSINEEFPSSPNMSNGSKYAIMGSVLKKGVNKASELISSSDVPMKNCVCITLASGVVLFESIDSAINTMMCYMITTNTNQQARMFFECAKAKTMLSSYTDDAIEINLTNNFVSFTQDNKSSYLRLINGSFFKVVKQLPKQFPYSYRIHKQEILSSLNRLNALVGKDCLKSCSITFSNMLTSITSKNVKGKIFEEVMCTGSPEQIRIPFLINTLIKTLSAMDSDEIDFLITERENLVIQAKNGNTNQAILISRIADTASTAPESKAESKKKGSKKDSKENSKEEVLV